MSRAMPLVRRFSMVYMSLSKQAPSLAPTRLYSPADLRNLLSPHLSRSAALSTSMCTSVCSRLPGGGARGSAIGARACTPNGRAARRRNCHACGAAHGNICLPNYFRQERCKTPSGAWPRRVASVAQPGMESVIGRTTPRTPLSISRRVPPRPFHSRKLIRRVSRSCRAVAWRIAGRTKTMRHCIDRFAAATGQTSWDHACVQPAPRVCVGLRSNAPFQHVGSINPKSGANRANLESSFESKRSRPGRLRWKSTHQATKLGKELVSRSLPKRHRRKQSKRHANSRPTLFFIIEGNCATSCGKR